MSDALQSELAAILEGAAIFSLNDRAFLRITGPDAARWLNGMVTNSISTLAPGEGSYNFLLNAQGRIQGDCTIYREPDADTFLLETGDWQVETVHQTLDRFIIMDDVELTPALAGESTLLLLGPRSAAILQSLALPPLDPLRMARAASPYGSVLLLTPAAATTPRHELRAEASTIAALRQAILAAGAVEVSAEAIEALRILEARPRFGQDIRDRDLPQETAQTHALHFNKGCYLGQEIVERIHSRGQVHRAFTQFALTGPMPALPAPLEAGGKPAGELTSAAGVPGHGLLALGYLRRELLSETLTYPGGAAVARENPRFLKTHNS